MRVFLYLRVSSEEQVKHGYSLDAQEQALTEFCEKNDHVVLGIYRDEGISARKPYTKRPAMVQLLSDLKKVKPDIILFTKLDRWFRNIKEYYKVQDILDKNKVYWKAINEEYDTSTASGRLYVNIKLSIAQDEADRTSERIKDVQQQLVMQGRVLSGSTPFGYKIKDKHLVFDDNAPILKEMIDWFMIHQSITACARHFNEKYGISINQARLTLLFKNTLLKGEYRGNKHFCEPIISEEEWDRLQDCMKRNIKVNTPMVYIFSGLMACPLCGNKLSAHCDGRKCKYYRCTSYTTRRCSYSKSISEKKTEKWLLEHVEESFDVEVRKKPIEKKESPRKYVDRLKRLNDMYLLGNISESEYRNKSAELQRTIADLQRVKKPVEDVFIKDWKEVYQMLDLEHRRAFWRGLIKEIKVDEEGQITGVEFLY